MFNEVKMSLINEELEVSKCFYTSPRLINYGQVRLLTQAGSMGGNETTANSTDKMASN